MGLKKVGFATTASDSKPYENEVILTGAEKRANDAVESGATAAISRLKTAKSVTPKPVENKYGGRDFVAEAKGKVKCVMFEAALQSPAIAGLQFSTLEEFLKLVEKAANAGVEYTWR